MSKLFKMLQSVSLSDGFSWDLRNEVSPTTGYAVSTCKDTELVLDHCPTELEIADYIVDHSSELLGNNENVTVLGLWADSGKWYVDVSSIVPNLELAIQLGKANSQLAIFDIVNLQSIYLGENNRT